MPGLCPRSLCGRLHEGSTQSRQTSSMTRTTAFGQDLLTTGRRGIGLLPLRQDFTRATLTLTIAFRISEPALLPHVGGPSPGEALIV